MNQLHARVFSLSCTWGTMRSGEDTAAGERDGRDAA